MQAPAVTRQNSAKRQQTRDLSDWLSREQAIDVLGCSMQTLRNLETRGWLHPQTKASPLTARQIIAYDPQELAAIPKRYRKPEKGDAGELTARVFTMLEEGRPLREIVIEVREPLDRVNEIREQWLDAGGAEVVLSPAARSELAEILGRAVPTVAELVAAVRAALGARNTNAPEAP